MKNIIIFIFAFGCSNYIFSQDSYKKRYYPEDYVIYITQTQDGNKKRDTVFLMYDSTEDNQQKSIKAYLNKYVQEKYKGQRKCFTKLYKLKANTDFKDYTNRVIINPWLIKDTDSTFFNRNRTYYYELQNRQSIKIKFKQWTLNSLSIPLKIRFGDETEFTTGANLGALVGRTIGWTNYVHRKDIKNKIYDNKITYGVFLGVDKLEFKYINPNNTTREINTAFLSFGTGLYYSYQKFTTGLTFGIDYGLAKGSKQWEYNGKPWLGISLGYALFSF